TVNSVIDHCTILNNVSYAVRCQDPLTTISNSIFFDNGYGYNNSHHEGTFSYIDNFGNGGNNGIPSGETWPGSFSEDPQISGEGFQIPVFSPCYGTGEGGTAIGATIQRRYVDGTLTDEDLWPWPMQDRILAELGIDLMLELENQFGGITSNPSDTLSYFVDYDLGSDANPGTSEGQPWKNISFAVGNSSPVEAGDTIFVKERAGGLAYPTQNNIEISGSGGNYITIKAYPGHSPII
ncbi:MAG: hypothetical protein GY751_05725, partial [Bacteroidetes bacterium]|nr:hypothetical protein [Bacteroidota bacterium]